VLGVTAEHLGDLSFEPVVAEGEAAVGGQPDFSQAGRIQFES
jgi:hypothetical protein